MEKNEQLLHEKFVKYGANAKAWTRQCVMLLPEINTRAIWKKKGFGSIYEYAAKLAGMSRNSVDDALRILEKIEGKPNLRLVAERKGLGAVRPVMTIATLDNEKFWAQKAAGMSKHTLETYVREYKKQERIDAISELNYNLDFRPGTEFESKEENNESVKMTGVAKIVVPMDLDPEIVEALQKLKGAADWNTLMKELLTLREEKIKSEKPEPVENASRYIPVRVKRHVLAKTNGQCAYPGCTKPYKILHHTQRFALESTHDPNRLMPLCKGHEAIAHHGLIENEVCASKNWRLRDQAEWEAKTYAIDRKVMNHRKL